MENEIVRGHELISNPLKIYNRMLDDIGSAQKCIYLETFRFENDPIGIRFRNLLAHKAQEGVKVMLLPDDWGTSVSHRFFRELIAAGGQVRYFKKLRISINFFSVNHERNHRKLLIIDEQISYISSLNINSYNLNWREISLRFTGNIASLFAQAFMQNWHLTNFYKFKKLSHTKPIICNDLEIIRDVPSVRFQRIRKKMIDYIRKAEKEVLIETPYFLPTYLLSTALTKAARKGVNVCLIIPRRSDVRVVDILRNHYLGKLYQAGVKIMYYLPTNLHSKVIVFDDSFYVGSSNLDYRSFRYMFEIGLFGQDKNITGSIRKYMHETLNDCIPFDYAEWTKRRISLKLIERLLLPVRHFL